MTTISDQGYFEEVSRALSRHLGLIVLGTPSLCSIGYDVQEEWEFTEDEFKQTFELESSGT